MDPVHVHHCATVKSEPCVVRHNTVVEALAAVVKSAGLTPYVEPRRTGMPHDAPRKRPDIIVYTARETLIIDVSLLHPLSPSYVADWRADNVEAELRLIAQRERRKRSKYAKLSTEFHGGVVQPFVIDAYGAFGQCADELLAKLAHHATDGGTSGSAAAFVAAATARIAVAVQRGNARLVEAALARIRAARGARVAPRHA